MPLITEWTPQRDDALRELRRQGLSFREVSSSINKQFGTTYSRNACIGRAKRLGMTCEVRGLQQQRAQARKEAMKPAAHFPELPPVKHLRTRPDNTIKARDRHVENIEKDTRPVRFADIEPKHLTLMQLSTHTCRWPYGGWPLDTPITFCGHWCPKDVPYCDAHEGLSTGPGTRTEQLAHLVKRDEAA